MHPERPHTYRITVEEADGRTQAHQLVAGTRELVIGDVLEQLSDGVRQAGGKIASRLQCKVKLRRSQFEIVAPLGFRIETERDDS